MKPNCRHHLRRTVSAPRVHVTAAFYALALAALTAGTPSSTAAGKPHSEFENIDTPLVFVVREQYRPDHHNTATFFPRARHEFNNGSFTPGGALKVWDPNQGGEVRTLVTTAEGVIRDPDVHFDGKRILFSMRRHLEDSYHIYEVQADGTGLTQLTHATDVDDLDPIYLPDDSIAFSSTREPKYCMCNRHIMANLYRMESDGANLHQIGKSTLFEGHPALMPDGRILYDRWEYVDRNFGDAQGLWTTNPDGTSHLAYWGNNMPSPGAVLDGRIIPGTDEVLCVFSSCHDRPWGALAIVDRRHGLDGRTSVIRTWPEDAIDLVRDSGWELFDLFKGVNPKYEDPYPLDANRYLCSRMTGQAEQMGIYLVTRSGQETRLHSEQPGCFDPMPLAPRPRPPVIKTRREFNAQEGAFYVRDVYEGTGMATIPRGTVKFLRVVESPEKRTWTQPSWNGQGQEAPAMNWHDFNNKRILGTVPVASDGSAYFSVPSERFVYFQLLDQRGMMVHSMRSGTLVQPGELTGCVGCHDHRRRAPALAVQSPANALQQAPQQLKGWKGPPRLFNYLTEVQPVFDRHCVRCHDFEGEAGDKLILAADRDLVFNASYNELWRKKLLATVGAGPADQKPPYAWGSSQSRLVEVLLDEHHEVKLSPDEFERIVTWIDINAPYYPQYASAHPSNLAGRSPLNRHQLERLEELTGLPLSASADFRRNTGPLISFDRPEQSPCLTQHDSLSASARQEAIDIIRAGADELRLRPEADQPGFVACEIDQWREAKYQARAEQEQQRREAIRSGARIYDSAQLTTVPSEP